MPKFKVGDVVTLAGNNIPLTIIGTTPQGTCCIVVWFSINKILETAKLPEEVLRPYDNSRDNIYKQQTEDIIEHIKTYWSADKPTMFDRINQAIKEREQER